MRDRERKKERKRRCVEMRMIGRREKKGGRAKKEEMRAYTHLFRE